MCLNLWVKTENVIESFRFSVNVLKCSRKIKDFNYCISKKPASFNQVIWNFFTQNLLSFWKSQTELECLISFSISIFFDSSLLISTLTVTFISSSAWTKNRVPVSMHLLHFFSFDFTLNLLNIMLQHTRFIVQEKLTNVDVLSIKTLTKLTTPLNWMEFNSVDSVH